MYTLSVEMVFIHVQADRQRRMRGEVGQEVTSTADERVEHTSADSITSKYVASMAPFIVQSIVLGI